jgi:hypothetical protein
VRVDAGVATITSSPADAWAVAGAVANGKRKRREPTASSFVTLSIHDA